MRDTILKTVLTRTFFPVGSVRRILRGPSRGMHVRLSRASGHAILFGYDRAAQRFLTTRVLPGMTVFDIGANCGHYALLLARLVSASGRVVACEPATPVFDELVANVRRNGLAWVHCEPAAVARAEGTIRFFSSVERPTMGKIEGADEAIDVTGYRPELVRATTIDSLAARWGSPAIVKVDTEGAAGEVLSGASATVRRFGPAFLIEVHGPSERAAVQLWARDFRYSMTDLRGCVVENLASHHVSPVWLQPAPAAGAGV